MRRSSLVLLLGLLLAPGSLALAQAGTAGLSGRVVSRVTRSGIPAARVEVLGTGRAGIAREDGTFRIEGLAPGIYAVRLSAIGYLPVTQANVVLGTGKTYALTVELERQPLRLETVAVTAAPFFQPALDAPSVAQALAAEEIRRAPGVGEDVVQSVALLPGVGVTTGGRNDLVVRGGAPFENLFLVDGVEVPNLNHFGSQGSTGGPLSLVNIDFVQDVEFSSGGFGVRYGGRTGSVTSVLLREGATDGVAGELNLSATGFGAMAEGPLGRDGSFLASVRRSYLDLIFALAGFAFRPTYYDATVKLVRPVGAADRLSLLVVGALDDLAFDNSTADNRYDNSRILATDQRQYVAGLTWQRSLRDGYLEVVLGRTLTRFVTSQADSLERTVFENRSREAVTSLRGQLVLSPSERVDLRLGQEVRALGPQRFRVTLPGEFRTDAGGVPRPLRVDTSFADLRAAGWAEGSVAMMDRVRLTAGLRYDLFGDLGGTARLSPRTLLAVEPARGTTITLAAGRYYQGPPAIWLVGDPSNPEALRPFRSDQVSVGVERLARPDLLLRAEGYVRRYRDYPARLFRPQSVLALSGFEDVTNDIPFGLEPLRSEGTGRSYGAELLARKRLSGSPWQGLASVSLSRTEFTGLDGTTRPGSFDTRLIGTLLAGYRPNPAWELSGKLRLATGRPTTPFVTAGPDAGRLDFARHNAGPRLPVFHAVDVRVDRRWSFRSVQLSAYLDVRNVYGRTNVSAFEWDPRTGTVRPDDSLGVFPTIGINLEF